VCSGSNGRGSSALNGQLVQVGGASMHSVWRKPVLGQFGQVQQQESEKNNTTQAAKRDAAALSGSTALHYRTTQAFRAACS
jgi:hypothetical protein